jgi:hypothetical protein
MDWQERIPASALKWLIQQTLLAGVATRGLPVRKMCNAGGQAVRKYRLPIVFNNLLLIAKMWLSRLEMLSVSVTGCDFKNVSYSPKRRPTD